MSIMSIICTILILFVVVVSHEFGHYIVAKSNGIYVKEFWVGFGPTIVSFNANGTRFCLKPIPFGGACVFEEDPETDHPEHLFSKANVWARIVSVLAGPVFNVVLAYILSVVIISFAGEIVITTSEVYEVPEGSAAYEVGIMPGDIITELDGKNIDIAEEMVLYSTVSDGSPVVIKYMRDSVEYSTLITPKYNEEYGRYLFGITFGVRDTEWKTTKVLKYSYYYVRYNVENVVQALKQLIFGKMTVKNLKGPVGMADMVNDTYTVAKEEGAGIVALNMVGLAILISANLGVMNLLPIPGLDGGRLLFLIYEAIRRKPVPREKEGVVTAVGFALLMILAVYVLYNDIITAVGKILVK